MNHSLMRIGDCCLSPDRIVGFGLKAQEDGTRYLFVDVQYGCEQPERFLFYADTVRLDETFAELREVTKHRDIYAALPSEYCRSILAFGAAGDGVTDDTGALKRALRCGGTVYFPPGIYLVHQQLFAEDVSVDWVGAGESSIIRLIPADDTRKVKSFHGFTVFSTRLLLLKNCRHIAFRNLTLDANKEAFDADICGIGACKYDYTTCLDIHGAESVLLEDMTFRGGLIEGVYIERTADIRIHRCRFIDNGFPKKDASGLQIAGPIDKTPAIFISDCEFSRNGFNGLELTGVYGAVISNIVCSGNGFDGIAFWDGSSRCILNGVFAEGNQRAGITFRRNHSAGYADVLQDSDQFCSNILISGLVTCGNRFGLLWGCAKEITVHGWSGKDQYNHALCFLYPPEDVTGFISGAYLSPQTLDLFNPVLTTEDGELYDTYGEVPISDGNRFRLTILP